MVFTIEKDTNIVFLLKKNKRFPLIAFTILYFCNIYNAFAEGFVQKKGHGIFIASFETRTFRGLNSLNEYTDDVRYTQGVLNLYGEYGLSNRLTIIGKIIAIDSMLMKDKWFLGKVEQHSYGLDTIEAKTRLGVIKNNKYIAVSVVAGFGAPSLYHYNEASQFAIRKYKQMSGLEVGINLSENDILMFVAYYNWNINYWYNELRLEIAYGHCFLDNILLMVRFQKFKNYIATRQQEDVATFQYQVSIVDFYYNTGFAKFTLSIAVPIDSNTTLEFGAYTSVKSKLINTQQLGLKMRGFYVSVWFTF